MRVLMTTASSSLLDGVNRHILTIASTLMRIPDVDVAVCSVCPRGELHDELEKSGVKTFSLNAANGHKLKVLWGFYKTLNGFNPQIIHIHILPLFVQVVASWFAKCRFVQTMHGVGGRLTKKGWLLNYCFPIRRDALFFVSKGVLEWYSRCFSYSGRKAVVYNPIELLRKNDTDLRGILGLGHNVPLVGTVCRIAADKNPVSFTRIMCNVLERHRSAHAVVMGDGDKDLLMICRQIVQARGFESRFHFMGYCANARELVADLSCFVMTSIQEGLPTAVLEAMSACVPVAFWKGGGGLEDLISMNVAGDPFALVANQGEEDLLAEQIVRLIGDETMRKGMGLRGEQVARINFDARLVSRQLYEEYVKVLKVDASS